MLYALGKVMPKSQGIIKKCRVCSDKQRMKVIRSKYVKHYKGM